MNIPALLDPNRFKILLRQAIALPLIMAVILSLFFLWQVRQLGEAALWVDHTDRVIAKAHLVERLMIDGQAGVRGYIIFGDPIYLSPYDEAIAHLPQEFKKLDDLCVDNLPQLSSLRELKEMSLQWLAMAKEGVARKDRNEPVISSGPNKGRGNRLMEDIRDRFDAFIKVEEDLRNRRAQESHDGVILAITMGLVLSILLGCIVAARTYRLVMNLSLTYKSAMDGMQIRARQSKEALRSRDDFLSIASHELKTPLTSLTLQLQMAQRAFRPNGGRGLSQEKIEQTIEVSLNQTVRLTRLVEDLLDVSRIQSGKLNYNFEEVDLSGLVREAVERLSEQFKMAESPVEILAPRPVMAVCDRFRMDQVLVNLLTNACKYGSGRPIVIAVDEREAQAQVVVRDQGIGIPEDKRSVIFERFERAVDSRHITGLGLGLYISQQIVAAHHGFIEVESEHGRGSSFIVTIPTQNHST